MRKETRNTLTAYLLFIYGTILLPVFLFIFKSKAYAANLLAVFGFALIISFACSMLFYNFKTKVRFSRRLFVYWSLLTLILLIIWMVICEGTFIIKEKFLENATFFTDYVSCL
jgi:heme O synthase-like polyprenyltransferase